MSNNLNNVQGGSEQLQKDILSVIKKNLNKLPKYLKQEEEYLTREEVAKLLKVNKSTVSNWKTSGTLNAYGLGGRVYFKKSEIDKAMIKIN